MVIGIDIDDVITDSSELIMEYAKKYLKSDDINLINNLLHGNDVNDELMNFYSNYLLKIQANYKLKENVKEVIDRLKLDGHKIVIITARGTGKAHPSLLKLDQISVATKYLKKHQINYDKIIFRARDKREVCIENNLDFLIDDSVVVLESIKDTNVKPVFFNSISNKAIKTDFHTVSSWLEIEEYINNNRGGIDGKFNSN